MVYVFLAEGFEESEALVTVDVLRRAGYTVLTAGVGNEYIKGSHGITVKSDVTVDKIEPTDELEAVVLPGGIPGTPNLEKDETVGKFIDFAAKNKKVLAAICAAPSILGKRGLLKDRVATCYPGFEEYLLGATYESAAVCISDNFITGEGAGAVFEFSLALCDLIAWHTGKKPFGDFSLSEGLEESMRCVR
ncbi:MAG: DJ-1/PfpI family protein [Clostridia bacterium]|nr:DJ-1/PfpI family protein [Clostridia bacterium]